MGCAVKIMWGMALGSAPVEARFESPGLLLGDRLRGVYRLLAEHGDRLFPDDYFADLYSRSRLGRPTIPARVLATVMVLQALEGLSDQEAVDHLECDLRWHAAAGVDAGYAGFHSTVLVGQRNRLRGSALPKRLLEDTRVAARESGVICDRVRVLDSTPIFDAVSTQDTVGTARALAPNGARVSVEQTDAIASVFTVSIRTGTVTHDLLTGWAGEGWPADVERLLRLTPGLMRSPPIIRRLAHASCSKSAASAGSTRPGPQP